jgi:outer membrane receptor protein involved in Fe transport
MIDGVPVNEPGGYYNFASQFPLELGRVEVVRGATSQPLRTDALAGVIHLVTRHAEPDETVNGSLEAEGGDFSWKRGKGSLAGRAGRLDWNGGLAYLETDNEQPNSAFEQTAGALALGLRLAERTTARAFLRGETSSAGTPGAVAYGRPDLDATFRPRRDRWVVGVAARGRAHGPRAARRDRAHRAALEEPARLG